MTWQLLISLSVLLYSVAVLVQRALLREEKSDPIAYSIFFQLLTGLFVYAFGISLGDISLPNNIGSLAINFLVMTMLYGLANIFIFNALKRIEASKFTILFSSRSLFTIIASSLIIQEGLGTFQLIGALLLFAGIVIVSLESSKIAFNRNDLLALAAGISFGFENTNDRIILKSVDIYTYTFIAFLLPPLFLALIYPKKIKKMKIFLEKRLFTKMLLLSLIYALTAITFYSALQVGDNSSQIAAINTTSVIVIVILSIIFLKERKNVASKILGAILSFIGLLLLR